MSNLFSGGSITVFFPAFNDEGSIAPLVTSALAVLSTLTNDYEVIVVDDGSTDRTPAIADQIAGSLSEVKVIHHPTNKGYGAALRTGFGHASKDFIFYTDGDGQYDVSELVGLCSLMSEGVDVVNGYKRKRQDSNSRRALGAIYNTLARFFFGCRSATLIVTSVCCADLRSSEYHSAHPAE
jgi:glycosyltransferase involved in cell wall biosynthesis